MHFKDEFTDLVLISASYRYDVPPIYHCDLPLPLAVTRLGLDSLGRRHVRSHCQGAWEGKVWTSEMIPGHESCFS